MNENSTGNNSITGKQLRTIPFLLESASIEEGCKRARIGKTTLYGWLKEASFREELQRRRKEVVDLALETVKANVNKAAETLVKHLDSERETISIRAAEKIIGLAQRIVETEELEQKIIALEERIKQRERERERAA